MLKTWKKHLVSVHSHQAVGNTISINTKYTTMHEITHKVFLLAPDKHAKTYTNIFQ